MEPTTTSTTNNPFVYNPIGSPVPPSSSSTTRTTTTTSTQQPSSSLTQRGFVSGNLSGALELFPTSRPNSKYGGYGVSSMVPRKSGSPSYQPIQLQQPFSQPLLSGSQELLSSIDDITPASSYSYPMTPPTNFDGYDTSSGYSNNPYVGEGVIVPHVPPIVDTTTTTTTSGIKEDSGIITEKLDFNGDGKSDAIIISDKKQLFSEFIRSRIGYIKWVALLISLYLCVSVIWYFVELRDLSVCSPHHPNRPQCLIYLSPGTFDDFSLGYQVFSLLLFLISSPWSPKMLSDIFKFDIYMRFAIYLFSSVFLILAFSQFRDAIRAEDLLQRDPTRPSTEFFMPIVLRYVTFFSQFALYIYRAFY